MCLVIHFEDCHYQLMVLQLMLLVFATEICGKEKKENRSFRGWEEEQLISDESLFSGLFVGFGFFGVTNSSCFCYFTRKSSCLDLIF